MVRIRTVLVVIAVISIQAVLNPAAAGETVAPPVAGAPAATPITELKPMADPTGAVVPAAPAAIPPAAVVGVPTGAADVNSGPVEVVEQPVLVFQVDDTSGTMSPVIGELARSLVTQYQRALRPGDLFVRLEFDQEARIAQMTEIHAAEDVENCVRVLAEIRPGSGDTRLSAGLWKAKGIALEKGAGRPIVLFLTSDGENDPGRGVSLATEEQQLVRICRWWKGRRDVQIVLVGVRRSTRSERGLARLAKLLGARRITLAQFANEDQIERTIQIVRSLPALPAPAPTSVVPLPTEPRRGPATPSRERNWALLAGLGLLGGWLAFQAWRSRRQPGAADAEVPELDLTLPGAPGAERAEAERNDPAGSPAWHGTVDVMLTVDGQTTSRKLQLPEEAPDGTLHFGERGEVELPGLPGRCVALQLGEAGQQLRVAPGVPLTVDGQPVPAAGGSFPVSGRFRLGWGPCVAIIHCRPGSSPNLRIPGPHGQAAAPAGGR
jgi:hypothetical protein